MAEVESKFVNFNGIPKSMVHEQTNKDGKTFYNVGITVPQEVSRNGIANVAVNKVTPVKDNPDKVNIGFRDDFVLKVSVCSYYNKDEGKDTAKYKTVEMKPQELLSAHIEKLKAQKEAKKDAPEEEADLEM